MALNGIVSRRINPFDPAVVSIGSIHGGHATNVIPSSVEISGTLRYMSNPVQDLIHKEIEKALQIVRVLGGNFELRIDKGYPPSFNHAKIVRFLRSVAIDVVGHDKILAPNQSMGAEDFGYYMEHIPGAMFFLGTRRDIEHNLHSPTFILEEDCLPVGSAMFAEAALRYLRQGLS
jgi:amidohydrolase